MLSLFSVIIWFSTTSCRRLTFSVNQVNDCFVKTCRCENSNKWKNMGNIYIIHSVYDYSAGILNKAVNCLMQCMHLATEYDNPTRLKRKEKVLSLFLSTSVFSYHCCIMLPCLASITRYPHEEAGNFQTALKSTVIAETAKCLREC